MAFPHRFQPYVSRIALYSLFLPPYFPNTHKEKTTINHLQLPIYKSVPTSRPFAPGLGRYHLDYIPTLTNTHTRNKQLYRRSDRFRVLAQCSTPAPANASAAAPFRTVSAATRPWAKSRIAVDAMTRSSPTEPLTIAAILVSRYEQSRPPHQHRNRHRIQVPISNSATEKHSALAPLPSSCVGTGRWARSLRCVAVRVMVRCGEIGSLAGSVIRVSGRGCRARSLCL